MDSLEEQLNHPFYKEAEAFRKEIERETMQKAAVKYPEPFNPFSWTIEKLAKHAMAENYDQQNYIYGMYQVMIEQEKEIKRLKKEIENKERHLQIFTKPHKKPVYFDLDD